MGQLNQFAASLLNQKDRIRSMNPKTQEKYADMVWRRVQLPKVQGQFAKPEDAEAARSQFVNSFLGRKAGPLPDDFGKAKTNPTMVQKTLAGLEAAGAGVAGGVGNIADTIGKGMGYLDDKTGYSKAATKDRQAGSDIKALLSKYVEGPAYADASAVDPKIASVAAGGGKAIPSALVAESAGAVLPGAGATASKLGKTAIRLVRGAGQGAAGMTAFSSDPSEIGKGAVYGAALEPVLGLMGDSLSRRPSKATSSSTSTGAIPTQTNTSVGNISQDVAKKIFNKEVKDLTPSEMAQHAKAVREELIARAEAAKPKKTPKASKVATVKVNGQKVPKVTRLQAEAIAKKQAAERAQGSAVGSSEPGANASTTGIPSTPPVVASPTEAVKTKEELHAFDMAKAAKAQNPQVASVMAAVHDFAGVPHPEASAEPVIQKIAEGEHGTGPLGKRARNAERKAAERAKAASEMPSTGNIQDVHGDIGKAPSSGKQSIHDTPSVELEDDLKSMANGKIIYSALQKMKTKGKWDDEVYRGHLIDAFTKFLQHSAKGGTE